MFEKLSPAVAGFIIMIALLLAAGGMFTAAYLPYSEYMLIEADCTAEAEAEVVDSTVTEDEGYFYGPQVEFIYGGRTFRAKAVNTVQPSLTHAEGEHVSICFEPNYLTDLLVKEDADAKADFRRKRIYAVITAVIGLIAFIVGAVKNYMGEPPEKKTYNKTPDGRTFEEWADSVRAGESDKDENAAEE